MLGAIIGDICGSVYEFNNRKEDNPTVVDLVNPQPPQSRRKSEWDACRFTDDSVLTVATAEVLLQKQNYTETYKKWGCRYVDAGFGGHFWRWMQSDSLEPYNSWGNGSAMRVSPVGWAFDTLEGTLTEAKRSAEVTHNHPEGIKGAQSTAAAIFLARTGKSKQEIKEYVETTFGDDFGGYDLNRTTDQIRPDYKFDVSCMGSVPEAIICFLESNDYAHAIQLAISIGGDTDTIACITGGIAEAFYREIPDELVQFAFARLTGEMKEIITAFREKFRP